MWLEALYKQQLWAPKLLGPWSFPPSKGDKVRTKEDLGNLSIAWAFYSEPVPSDIHITQRN